VAYIGSIIALWIAIAVVFGFTVGWLARGRTKSAGRSRGRKKARFR
jgi:hypothetical protein